MQLIDQHTKAIMEGCKARAREAGLSFQDQTLEYIVTNRDLIELSPRMMIPTLYDYWVHDVELLKEKGKYEPYPANPHETVINTRPAISFYNDNNPDWLNVMIFYHVLAHIDFFQNNLFFRHTWDYDFTGQALSDKRLIASLRSQKGRWVDYVIEFTRAIDNIVHFHAECSQRSRPESPVSRIDYYFDSFLQQEKKVSANDYLGEINRLNQCRKTTSESSDDAFFETVYRKYPEFDSLFNKYGQTPARRSLDIISHLMTHSRFLNRHENRWMQSVMTVVRKTSLFFQPQIRTKIMNEGWASYWHEKLFLTDDRIKGHEIDFARVHAGVTAMPRVGLNPYALGMRLFAHIERMAGKGRYAFAYQRLADRKERRDFDAPGRDGLSHLFEIRENLNDFLFIQTYVDQEFMDAHRLFLAGRRLNPTRMVWEYFVKSRKADAYREMLTGLLYHPPHITVDEPDQPESALGLTHHFEGKPLVREYNANTMMGIEYLWEGPVHLVTHEPDPASLSQHPPPGAPAPKVRWQKVRYVMKDRKLTSQPIGGLLDDPFS